MKDMKVSPRGQTKDMKITEKTEREHKINHNTPTWTTNVSTMQVITQTCYCPTRHQYEAPLVNNPVGSSGTHYQYSSQFQQPSPQQHSQQSQSTVRSSTPVLITNNP